MHCRTSFSFPQSVRCSVISVNTVYDFKWNINIYLLYQSSLWKHMRVMQRAYKIAEIFHETKQRLGSRLKKETNTNNTVSRCPHNCDKLAMRCQMFALDLTLPLPHPTSSPTETNRVYSRVKGQMQEHNESLLTTKRRKNPFLPFWGSMIWTEHFQRWQIK